MAFTIQLDKESFKFSGTHFTIFGPDDAERLHGHNYQVRCGLEVESLDPKLGMAFDFNVVKPVVKAVCDELDEYILLPVNSPFLKLEEKSGQVEIVFNKKRYSFPQEDVRQLPLVNITSEELARYILQRLAKRLSATIRFKRLIVSVEETRGQSVSYEEVF